jgi:hypothetical protein
MIAAVGGVEKVPLPLLHPRLLGGALFPAVFSVFRVCIPDRDPAAGHRFGRETVDVAPLQVKLEARRPDRLHAARPLAPGKGVKTKKGVEERIPCLDTGKLANDPAGRRAKTAVDGAKRLHRLKAKPRDSAAVVGIHRETRDGKQIRRNLILGLERRGVGMIEGLALNQFLLLG